MKTSILFIFTTIILSINSFKADSQEIRIDSLFQLSGECYPFQGIDSITSLRISGSVNLKSDTSLARVILICTNGAEFMVFEAFPLIESEMEFSFSRVCDESCFLDWVYPYSIRVQIVNADLEISTLVYDEDDQEDLSQLQFAAKRAMDYEKIEMLNRRITEFNMYWIAGDNNLVELYYEEKKILFGEAYNILGYEYYNEGVFEFLGHRDYPKVNPDLVRQYDWRDRHGANDSLSYYWDGDTCGTGWLTSVKDQGSNPICYVYGANGVTEALANVYNAYQWDLDLSEQDLSLCLNSPSHGGDALAIIRDSGVVTDYCLPIDSACIKKCNPIDSLIKINDTVRIDEVNYDSVRIAIIKHGPLLMNYSPVGASLSHVVALSGFSFNPLDSTLNWIFKDSYGPIIGDLGFNIMPLEKLNYVYEAQGPVLINDTTMIQYCVDADLDGYYFWGLGSKPDSLSSEAEEDCNDNDPFVGGYDENFNCACIFPYDPTSHVITSDTSWTDSTYVNYTLIIDSAASLTISSYVGFSPEAGIIVKQGGELIIDGGYLTKVCPDLWRGIQAWGSDTVQYFNQFFGKVILRNNATVEFAKTGIANHCTLCDHYLMQSGGIILAENSIFRDNETDISLAPFRNEWYGNELPYYSSFQRCEFITTDLLYRSSVPKSHVEMKDVTGVTFRGCTFNNELVSSTIPFYDRGTGISSVDASFILDTYCCSQITPCPSEYLIPCEFSNLEYGVKALNSFSIKTLTLQNIDFNHNIVGVSLSGIDNVSVLSNNFYCKKIDKNENDERFVGGLFLENCTGYHIEDNYFGPVLFGGTDTLPGVRYGIGIKNSGPEDNEIYNNEFTKLNIGIIAIGENRGRESGLCLKCNDMSFNVNDFFIIEDENPPSFTEQGIAFFQGNPNDSISEDAPAGNIFTSNFNLPADSINLMYYNYLNNAEDIYYFHHAENQTYLIHPLDSHYTINTIELKEWSDLEYVKETACPSGICGGGLKSSNNPMVIIIEADNHIVLLNDQLLNLIDGGNTDSLNFKVIMSLPDEGLELRTELLAESPYLSDTVLKQSIFKENVLPNAMIRDILEANPHSAKSQGILSTLNSRLEPMPDFMMSQIMEGKKCLGAKELLEAKIQSWRQIRARAKAELMRQFLLDTNQSRALDSVITFLEDENDLQSKYDLALTYWCKNDGSNAQLTLDNIPSDFGLSTYQTAIHAEYENYFNLLEMMRDSSWMADDIDSIQIQQLFDIIESDDGNLAANARGLLVKGGYYKYIERVPLPAHLKVTQEFPLSPEKNADDDTHQHLKIFPNPTGDYAIIQYDLNDQGIIEIAQIDGTILKSVGVDRGTNQMILDLKNLPNGMYIISLKSDRQALESVKLIKGGY